MMIVLYVVLSLVALVLACTLAGFALPRAHQAARTTRLARSADDVWRAIRDVDATPRWRRGVTAIERPHADPTQWRERSRHGVIAFALDEDSPPTATRSGRMVSRITDDSLPFGGRWIFVVATDGDGARVTVTEDGFVSNPLFRFLSRFVFGHATTLEQYLSDLGRHLGVTATPQQADPLV
jgi:hypothetical protein